MRFDLSCLNSTGANRSAMQICQLSLNPFMDTPRVKWFSIGCERVIGCSHLSGLKGAAI